MLHVSLKVLSATQHWPIIQAYIPENVQKGLASEK